MRRWILLFTFLHAGVTISMGDFIAQYFIEERTTLKTYDKKRTAQFLLIGCTLNGPSALLWYRTLDKFIKGSKFWVPVKKMTYDQIICSPLTLAAMFTYVDILNFRTAEEMKERFRNNYFKVLKDSYCFWPVVQTINFGFVQSAYRVLFVRSIALVWNTYICWSIYHPRKSRDIRLEIENKITRRKVRHHQPMLNE